VLTHKKSRAYLALNIAWLKWQNIFLGFYTLHLSQVLEPFFSLIGNVECDSQIGMPFVTLLLLSIHPLVTLSTLFFYFPLLISIIVILFP
jgi:hypothetical protein